MPKVVVDVEALYGALETRRERKGASWREIATDLDLSPSTFTRLAQGQRPDIDTFSTLLAWLDLPATTFARTVGELPDAAAAAKGKPLVEITTLLSGSNAIKPAEADALNSIITAAYNSIVKD